MALRSTLERSGEPPADVFCTDNFPHPQNPLEPGEPEGYSGTSISSGMGFQSKYARTWP